MMEGLTSASTPRNSGYRAGLTPKRGKKEHLGRSYEVVHIVDKYTNKRRRLGNGKEVKDVGQVTGDGYDRVEDVAVFDCNLCSRPLSNDELRFKCADEKCAAANFHMCAECFGAGKEAGTHLKTHPYRVFHSLGALSLENSDWGFDEEILLLEGIELYGFGNWAGVSSHVSEARTPQECESHYMDKYVYGFSKFKPLVKTNKEKKRESLIALKLEKAQRELPSMPGYQVSGYMPLREDFDVEYLNDAEKMIAGVKFDTNEVKIGQNIGKRIVAGKSPKEIENILYKRNMKLGLVKTYNRTLDEREYRKAFIKNFGLLDMEKRKQARKYSKEQKTVRARLRPLIQYMSNDEYEELVAGIIREAAIKARVEQLKAYRKMGLRSFEEISAFKQIEKRQVYSSTPSMGINRHNIKNNDDVNSDSARTSRSRRTRKKRVIYTEGPDSDTDSPCSDSNGNVSDDNSETKSLRAQFDETKTTPIQASLVPHVSNARTQQSTNPPNARMNEKPADMKNVLGLCTALQVHPCQISQAKKIIIDECVNRKILKRESSGAIISSGTKKDSIVVDMNKTGNVIDFNVRVASTM